MGVRALPGVGFGSNGRFDYAAFSVFDGAAVKDIKLTSYLHYPLDPATPYPLDPTFINASNPTTTYPDHSVFQRV